jgi:D-amino-acid dehydrogenase
VVVVGAGVIGVCTAWRLLRRGFDVSLIDRDAPGMGCSFGNAGGLSSGSVAPLGMPGIMKQGLEMLLDPKAALHIPAGYWLTAAPWLLRLVRASRADEVERIARALGGLVADAVDYTRELLAAAGAPDLIRQTGQLYLYRDENELAKDRSTLELRRRHGMRVEKLSRSEILDLEPDVGPAYNVAMFNVDQGMTVNPLRHVRAIATDFQRCGGRIEREQIISVEVAGDRVAGVRGEGRRFSADNVVIALGARSAALLQPLGYRVPLESQRGYSITLADTGVSLNRPVVASDRKVFFSPLETGLRLAGTVEFGGLERPPTRRRAELLVECLGWVFPQARVPSDWDFWIGHRPSLPDSMPVLGGSSRHAGLWFNFGHGHLGLTMSARSSEVLAALIAGEASPIDLSPFSIHRFRARVANP